MGFIHPMPFQVSSIILVDDWAMFNSNVRFPEGNWWLLGVISSWDNIYIYTHIVIIPKWLINEMVHDWNYMKLAHDFTWCTQCGIHNGFTRGFMMTGCTNQLEKWTDGYILNLYCWYIYIHGCCWWYIHMILMVY